MVASPVIFIVAANCQPEDDERFNAWYNEVHIPMLFKFEKLQGVIRYKASGESSGKSPYLAIYRFADQKDFEEFTNSPELAAAIQEMQESWGQKIEIVSRVQYELVQEWSR